LVDKNFFLYDLAVVAIFKDEGHYLKEWLDYHLLAGVEHFYLYNNDSSDDYKEVLAPYVEKNLVTLIDFPGKMMQYPAYEDAIENYRFECRYMAFIDLDEFIFPKTNRSIVEVVDEILLRFSNATGLAINWQCFGSNGQEKADYSRGVLERFTRRAPSDWPVGGREGNHFIKTISNPRFIRCVTNPHFANYFEKNFAVNSAGENISLKDHSESVLIDKIVINHYNTKSREEYTINKIQRGFACSSSNPYSDKIFNDYDRNEIFDDGILKYRATREKIFSFESDNERISRMISSVFKLLTECSPIDAPEEFFVGKLETFLTCRAVAEKFQIKIYDKFAEELALNWIYATLIKANPLMYAEVQIFMKALPEILSRPFQICRELKDLLQVNVLPRLCEALKNGNVLKGREDWKMRSDVLYLQKLLRFIK